MVGGGAAGYLAWQQYQASQLPAGIFSVNGRVEATQVDISTKVPGRVMRSCRTRATWSRPVRSSPGSTRPKPARSWTRRRPRLELARQTLVTRQADVASDDAQLQFANEEMRRTATLVDKGWSTHEQYDQRKQQLKSADAALKAAQSQVDEARASVKTADAKVEELQAVVNDSEIKSPVKGRVQYRLVEPGAVLPPGGKIATVIDLSDVYTTVFLPAPVAGRLKIGDEARVVVDAYPDYVFPATVSFVAPESQFTPKTVEVQSEREQLMFRVKLQAPLQLLKGIEDQVKAGLRGMGYVRTDFAVQWPPKLVVNLPPTEQAGK